MLAGEAQRGGSQFCCAPGLTKRDIATILGVFPRGLASHAPVFAMGGRRAATQETVVLASESLLHLFGARNLDGLAHFFSGGKSRRSQSPAAFAATLALNGAPCTAALPFRIGDADKTITFLCRRVTIDGAPPLSIGAVLDIADQSERASPLETGAAQAEIGPPQAAASRWNEKIVAPLSVGGGSGRTSLEMELRRQKSEFRELSAILDVATDGVAVLDWQGLILSLNHSGEALFGYDQNEVVGKHIDKLIAPESRTLATDYFEGLKKGGGDSLLNQGREVLGLARQGGIIPIFMTLGRIRFSQETGKLAEDRFCAILRDLTHWKKIEQELEGARKDAERASALNSDFLAKVSHEIRTPLHAILGFAEVMLGEQFGPVGNERYKEYLKDIHTSGALVMSLVNDLLDLSKIEAGKMDFAFAPIDANRVVSECVSIMQAQANQARVVLKLSLSPALPNILADERSLRQIVLNLLSNAVKFNQADGQVTVATALADAGSVVIRIRDTGTGMSEADIGAALEPFRRLATARSSSGTGLGLPLTKALVEANHASLIIKSKEDVGTLVEVFFPPARILAE